MRPRVRCSRQWAEDGEEERLGDSAPHRQGRRTSPRTRGGDTDIHVKLLRSEVNEWCKGLDVGSGRITYTGIDERTDTGIDKRTSTGFFERTHTGINKRTHPGIVGVRSYTGFDEDLGRAAERTYTGIDKERTYTGIDKKSS